MDGEKMKRALRYLRIGWSVFFGVLCVLLITLWIRSHSHPTTRQILVTSAKRYYLHSFSGTVAIQVWQRSFSGAEFIPIFQEDDLATWLTPHIGFKIVADSRGYISAISFSYWLLTAGALFLTSLPLLPNRFSLRNLLIATTLVALALGLYVSLR